MDYYHLLMRNTVKLFSLAVFVVLGSQAFGISPIATVTSAEPFTLNGNSVATNSGITSMPLEVGSEVGTLTAPVVLFFGDGSSVKLAASSRAKLAGSDAQPKLILLAGSLDYKVVLGSKLSVTNLDLERTTKRAGLSVRPAPKPLSTPRTDSVTLISN